MTSHPRSPQSRLGLMFQALKSKNFRIFFIGHGISLVGTWTQQVAMSWMTYRLTDSPLMLGLAIFVNQIPSLILSPAAGVLIDRHRRQRILFVTQTLAMLQAFTLAALTLNGQIAVWHIMVLGLFIGCVNAVTVPARQAFVRDLVGNKETLGNAIALNAMLFNLIRLTAPLLAGGLIARLGEGPCFLINGVSFLAVLISLAFIRIRTEQAPASESHLWRELKEGVHYAWGVRPIRHVLLLVSAVNVMGFSFVVLMPVFAKTVLGGGPSTLGMLMSAIGLGALVATLLRASHQGKVSMGMSVGLPASASLFAVALIVFSISRTVWLSLFMIGWVGFAVITHLLLATTLLQTLVDDNKRGRVMSFYTMALDGLAPIGALLAGFLARALGPTPALIMGGVACIVASLLFYSYGRGETSVSQVSQPAPS